MIIHAPRPLSEYTQHGLLALVQRAEVVLAALSALGDGDVDVRIGTPAYRCPLPAALVREALVRRIDDVRVTLSRPSGASR